MYNKNLKNNAKDYKYHLVPTVEEDLSLVRIRGINLVFTGHTFIMALGLINNYKINRFQNDEIKIYRKIYL